MPAWRRLILLVLPLAIVTAACDRTPVDPQDPNSELALLLGDAGAAGMRAPLSLPGLLHSAVDRVYREQGPAAARALIMDLRQLHHEVQQAAAAGDREATTARIRALHEEQLRIVLSVFGDGVAARVSAAVAADAARLRQRVQQLEQAGHAVPRALDALAHVDELLVDAAAATEAGDARAALDAATRAAGLAEVVRRALADAVRLPGIDQLFDRAVARLRQTAAPEQVREALAEYHRLEQIARAAVRSGDRQTAHDALQAVRGARIAFVLRVLGDGAVAAVLQQSQQAAGELTQALTAARASGRDVTRLERMMGSARDMLERAQRSFMSGDAAAALDLGSHAAGLLNAIRAAL